MPAENRIKKPIRAFALWLRLLSPLRAALCLVLLGSLLPVLSQEADGFPVQIDSVQIFGNKTTQRAVIMREIPFQFPALLDMEDLQLIQNRLSNLFLFNRVELGIMDQGGINVLVIELAEILYIYPLPLLFINERDWSKVSYGFQLTHVNFRGMHERASVGGWLGYNPSFFLQYSNPWVGRHARLIVGFSAFAKRVRNKLSDIDISDDLQNGFPEFDEQQIGGGITLGKRLNLTTSVQANFDMRRIRFSDFPQELSEVDRNRFNETYSESGTGTDYYPRLTLRLRRDLRDLFEYPRKGYLLNWQVTRGGFTNQQADFWRYEFDHRLYVPISGRLSLAGRNYMKLNTGDQPVYDRTYIGFRERIRGYFNTVVSGQNIMMHGYEMRFSLIPVRYLKMADMPLGGQFLQQLKYGLSMGIFVDSGIAWNRRAELALANHRSGYGLGLHFHVPYINVLRVDHAWNDDGEREWVIEAGVAF